MLRRYKADLGITLPLTATEVEKALEDQSVGAVWITAPTYDGFVADLAPIASLCRRRGALLIVDAAWGVLHGWAMDLGFPPSAIQAGASASVTSLHKKGLGPSMASAAFFNDLELAAKFTEVSNLGFATTSPNAVAAAITLQRLKDLNTPAGRRAWGSAVSCATDFTRLVSLIPGCRVVGTADIGLGVTKDPTHVVVNISESGANGFLVQTWFGERRVDLEKATHNTVMPLFGPGEASSAVRLANALAEALRDPSLQSGPCAIEIALAEPEVVMTSAEAFYARRERVPFRQSEGRVAAQMVGAYPPGQAVIGFGERISASAIASLVAVKAVGGRIHGISEDLETALIETVAE
jgi:arginine/lysine/ornithine decarboxylase